MEERSDSPMEETDDKEAIFHENFRKMLLIDIVPNTAAASALALTYATDKSEAIRERLEKSKDQTFLEGPFVDDDVSSPFDEPDKKPTTFARVMSLLPRRMPSSMSSPKTQDRAERPAISDAVWQRTINAFGDFSALNTAFAPGGVDPLEGATEWDPAIDFVRLEKFYAVLSSVIESRGHIDQLTMEIFAKIRTLCDLIETQYGDKLLYPHQLRFILILLECPLFEEFVDFEALIELLRIVTRLPANSKEILGNWYRAIPTAAVRRHVATVQQMITIKIVSSETEGGLEYLCDSNSPIIRHALGFLSLVHTANRWREEAPQATAIDFREFNNDAVNTSDVLLGYDFRQWFQNQTPSFGFIQNSFILDAASKAQILRGDSTMKQQQELRQALFRAVLTGSQTAPFFVLFIRRSHLIQDALDQLMRCDHANLRKQLKVKFKGEEGVDEGGPTKEFFQLLVQELFNPDFGMFIEDPDTRLCWFNPNSFETNLEFELIGVVLGLAIYNGVILNVHFPLAVYKKLQEWPCGIEDLREFQPNVAKSIEDVQRMDAECVEDLCLTFSVIVERFGSKMEIPLGKHDVNDRVTADNRDEYCKLTLDWYLHASAETQFDAFLRGFRQCCGGQVPHLFRPEELQLVICGSAEIEFDKLEKGTQYQDGFTESSQTVREFWTVAHALSQEDKRKLLFFVTGSDRVPIKGLASLRLTIGRNGPDNNKLPTAHTCFNYLLLPDYKSKEKMEKFLRIALENSQGFGLR